MTDLLLQGGRIVDGTGAEPYPADVRVSGGFIVEIIPRDRGGADRLLSRIPCSIDAVASRLPCDVAASMCGNLRILDVSDRVVTPGFIDFHRHCDVAPFTRPDFGELELAQGITTVTAGNCGLAPLPIPLGMQERSAFLDFLEPIVGKVPASLEPMLEGGYEAYAEALSEAGLRVNFAFLAASGAVKTQVKGFSASPYAEDELSRAAWHVEDAMRAGAVGLSLGIMYPPEVHSTAAEMARVALPAASRGGVLTAHVRGEGDGLLASIDEVLRIAEIADMPLNISHFKATGLHNWRDAIFRAIERIEAARAQGRRVTADFYPYDGGSSMLLSLIPPMLLGGDLTEALKRLATADGKRQLREALRRRHSGWDNMVESIGWERILVSSVTKPEHEAFAGRSMAELAESLGIGDPADLAAELLCAENGKAGVIVRSMSPEDVDDVARLPWTALISDSLYGGGGNPHPRLYGAFPKFLREFVYERNLLLLPQAVRKMTAMPAERMGLTDRGMLKPGMRADIAVFDPSRVADCATWTQPRQLAVGMDLVLVNGCVAWQGERMTENRSGKVVRRGR